MDPDNTPFVSALQKCGDEFNPRNRENLYRELLKSTLLIPINRPRQGAPDGGLVTLQEDPNPDFLMKTNPETGEHLMFAFTDRDTLAIYKVTEFAFTAVPAPQLMQMLSGPKAPSLFICAQEAHLPVTREEVMQLAAGIIPPPQLEAIPNTMRGRRQIEFRELDEELPDSVRRQLAETLKRYTEVKGVYVFLVRENNDDTEFAAGVIFSPLPADEQAARPMLDEIAKQLKPSFPGEGLLVFPLPENDEFARHIAEVIPAFYKRQVL